MQHIITPAAETSIMDNLEKQIAKKLDANESVGRVCLIVMEVLPLLQ